jgi:neutral ceramidase
MNPFRSATALLLLVGTLTVSAEDRLFAGIGQVDITPQADVPLSGPVGGGGKATKIHDRLYARAIAIRSGDTQIVLCVADITIIASDLHNRIRDLVHQKTGLPKKHLLVSATHTHRSPRAMALDLGPAHERYKSTLVERIAEAVGQALKKMEPARIGWASVDKPEFCKNRRWLMKPGSLGPDPFGNRTDQAAMYGGPGKNGIRTTGPIDPELFVMSIQRPDGSQLGVLANFSIHYGSGGSGVSADYFGHFSRETANAMAGKKGQPMVALMSNGTSGNIAPAGNPPKVGKELAVTAAKLIGKLQHKESLSLEIIEKEIPTKVRRPDKNRIIWARAVLAGTWKKPAHKWKGKFAKSALWLSDYPETVPVRLQAIRLGDLAIMAMPNEVYAETGLAIKNASSFPDTFTISLANGYNGYLPTPEQHALGGYTTWPAVSSCLATNAEPMLRLEAINLLQSLKQPKP